MAATAVLLPSSMLSSLNPESQYNESEHHKHGEVDVDSKSVPEIFLVKKMSTVLTMMGYDEDSHEKVASLVFANVVDASVTLDKADSHTGAALSDLLMDEKTLQRKGLRLNSNEPVILVEGSELMMENGQLDSVKADLLDSLRAKGIKPVRAYTRVSPSPSPSITQTEVKALILNVVNTDIGGPSMVQLLDAAFYGEDWKQELMSKEAWNGYDLIWRDQVIHHTSPSLPQEATSEPISKNIETEVEGNAEPEAEIISQVEDTVVPETDTGKTPERDESVHVEPVPDNEPEIVPVEHPDMKALREQELQRAAVQHPTWDRTHEGQSLLDIITTQSAGVSATDPISVISTADTSEEKDDFEVIEKP